MSRLNIMKGGHFKKNVKLIMEVGMAVLKSKQTRIYYSRDNQDIYSIVVHPYACFLSNNDTITIIINTQL